MTEEVQRRQRKRWPLWLALTVVVLLLAVAVLPPMVSINRYKSRIIHLMSESLGRPVRLSSVEMRLLPAPAFVLTDLTVQEDPAYGAEPVLHANTVTASIRLLSLWRGRLEIGTISVDEASLNVVRTAEGRWNLDPLFRTAAAKSQPANESTGQTRKKRVVPLPYLQATNSRINFKSGAEKLPFSLVETDLSFWQEEPGDWRIRLRGQPARTDVSLDLADTGLVRLEARLQSAAELRRLPLHLDLEWREAQLGQLTRLLIGSDAGWRGDLTGELHLDGTADAAQISTRLRAAGVHRAEFAPAAPMDFDASCAFLYHLTARAVEHLACDSPLGDGRIHLAGDLPGDAGEPRVSLELDRIPVAAGLDALRTVRSDFGPGLEAAGTISGKISYAGIAGGAAAEENTGREKKVRGKPGARARAAKVHPLAPGPLTGSFTVDGFQLSGDRLSAPIQASKLVLEPMIMPAEEQNSGKAPASVPHPALEATMTIPAGGVSPLAVTARLAFEGYAVNVHGQASVARARELARVAGMVRATALDSLAGDPVSVDLDAAGPWMTAASAPFAGVPASAAVANSNNGAIVTNAAEVNAAGADAAGSKQADLLTGTVTMHNASWKADYLANHVLIEQATLHLDNAELRWDPVVFSYGPVKGTANLQLPARCATSKPCAPKFAVQFGELDASALQAAILGAHERGTLLSSLIARLKPSDSSTAPAWPLLEGTVKADSLILGPVTLTDATATLRIVANGAEITDLDADLLGGHVHGGGTLRTDGDGGKPAYTLEGQFEKLNPSLVGQLLGENWSGRSFDANGKIDLAGFTAKDLADSAKGTLHFDWRHGMMMAPQNASSEGDDVSPALARFDRWSANADIANGKIALKHNEVQQGSHKRAVDGTLTLGDPPKLSFTLPKETQAKR